LPLPRTSGSVKPISPLPVVDDPPTPVPAGGQRFPGPDEHALGGGDDAGDRTAMVPAQTDPNNGDASATLSGDDDEYSPDKTNVVGDEVVAEAMARAGVAPAITPSGTIDSSGALPVAGGNPWRDPESTASAVTPGEDFARRPTAESPLAKFAELSELAQRPVVLLAGGGVVLLLLIVAVVLLLRSPVPNAGSIVEVKAPPRPAWKSDLPPDAPAPVAAPVAPPAPAPAPAPPPEPAPVVVAPPPPEVEEEPAPAPVPVE
jgi:hypothetical protein